MSDANVGDPVASFVGLDNFRAALEMRRLLHRPPQQHRVHRGGGRLQGPAWHQPRVSPASALLGKKLIRGLVVIPFTLPITISVLGWKWMYDSQFSVINWVLSRRAHRLLRLRELASLARPAPPGAGSRASCVNVWRNFPFSAIVLLAGFTSVPHEVLDAAQGRRRQLLPAVSPRRRADDLADPHDRLPVRHGVHAVRPGRRVSPDPGRSRQRHEDSARARLPDRDPGGQPRPRRGDRPVPVSAARCPRSS